MREFEYVEGVGVTFNNEAIQNKMKRCVDHMMAEHNRLEDEATINALRNYGYEVIKWHHYPHEKPPKFKPCDMKSYLVTIDNGSARYVREVPYASVFIEYDESIIAWAELPQPYEG